MDAKTKRIREAVRARGAWERAMGKAEAAREQARIAVQRAHDAGASYQEIGDALGVTRARAQQLARPPDALV